MDVAVQFLQLNGIGNHPTVKGRNEETPSADGTGISHIYFAIIHEKMSINTTDILGCTATLRVVIFPVQAPVKEIAKSMIQKDTAGSPASRVGPQGKPMTVIFEALRTTICTMPLTGTQSVCRTFSFGLWAILTPPGGHTGYPHGSGEVSG